MRVALTGVVATTLLVASLTACGGGDEFERYCKVVKDERADLTAALRQDDGAAGLLPGLPTFRKLEKAAPDDIADDWSVVTQRLGALSEALEKAGVDPSSYDPHDPPDDVTSEQREAIELGAGSVNTEEMREALGNVQQEAKDVCHTSLTLL